MEKGVTAKYCEDMDEAEAEMKQKGNKGQGQQLFN
jgi:hypothetical protein